MAKAAMIRARIEPDLKERAEAVIEQLGLNVTTAITLFYQQIVLHHGLPFDVRLPNTTTRKAMRDARAGRNLVRGTSVTDLVEQLDSE